MRVITPITLNSTNITSDAPIDPTAVWDTNASYSIGNRVKVTTGTPSLQKVYECISPTTNTDYSPEVDVLRSVPKWVDIGPTNEYAMFDLLRDTRTVADNTTSNNITVTLTPGMSISSLACLGLKDVLRVEVFAYTAGTTLVYSNSFDLNLRFTKSWYTYFYGAFREKTACILFDLPTQYSDLTIKIIFSGYLSFGVGAVVVGNYTDLGNTLNNSSVDTVNFSSIDRDTYGTANLVARRSIPKTVQKTHFNKSKLVSMIAVRDALDSVPAVWSGMDDEVDHPYFESLLVLGFYRTFNFDISNPIEVFTDIEVEEI